MNKFLLIFLLLMTFNVNAFNSINIKSFSSLKKFEKASWKIKSSQKKYWRLWQASLKYTVYNKATKSIKLQKYLVDKNSPAVSLDKLYLALGRNYYQLGLFQEAIENYSQVSKNSDSWLEAKEELAWSYLRQKNYGRAKAELKTVLSPLFKAKVNSEVYLLSGIASLKTCDYNSVFKVVELFKKRTRVELVLLESKKDYTSKARLKQFSKTLNSMQILEAEAIQRLHGLKQAQKSKADFENIKSNDYLVFPYDGDESWLDELDNYQIKSNHCNTKRKS